jgi:apolipoprotein D and lipocalin family protein
MNTTQKRILQTAAVATVAGAAAYLIARNIRRKALPLQTVLKVDIARYLGDWYDIAHLPNRFQRNRYGAMAHYSLNPDGTVKVVNTCYKGSLHGKMIDIEGKARIVDPVTNAKLKVQFFWPFEGDYWIIDLDEDYQWALVGEPSRKYMWILSREPKLHLETIQYILTSAESHGFDVHKLVWEQHSEGKNK